jgi:hypothetical protein
MFPSAFMIGRHDAQEALPFPCRIIPMQKLEPEVVFDEKRRDP